MKHVVPFARPAQAAPVESSEYAIRMREVCFTYESGARSVEAIQSINLDVEPQQFVSIIGPSGCGKSTLLRMLAGFLPPTTGEVLLNGMLPSQARALGLLGIVFQQPVLLPWRDVLSNVAFLLELQGVARKEREERARAYIDLVGLGGFERHRPEQLSGGMQQRASIARALTFNPSILLMDEPFGALDAITRDRLAFDLLRICNSAKKTVVFITHSVQEAALLSDLVVVMTPRPGRIQRIHQVELGRPREREHTLQPEFIALTRHLTDDLQVC